MFDYQKILNQNMQNVVRDILKTIEKNGISNNNQLYITFSTYGKKVELPKWLKEKYPEEMTIIIQHEYYNLKIYKKYFNVTLSFNDIKTELKIDYSSIISIADPIANFGLKFRKNNNIKNKTRSKENFKNNVINFKNYKK